MSLRTSCSCSAIVPVEMTTFLPERSAGTRYASDLPTPVPASTIVCAFSRMPRSISCAICTWPGRASKPGSVRAIGPLRAEGLVDRASCRRLRVFDRSVERRVLDRARRRDRRASMRCAYAGRRGGVGRDALAAACGRARKPHEVPAIRPPMWS